ncbi:hypothetical protein TOPH_08179, partial [Tolypocladium ophioglossoides CBS 100239]
EVRRCDTCHESVATSQVAATSSPLDATVCKTKYDLGSQSSTRQSGFVDSAPPRPPVLIRPIIVHAGAQPNNSTHAGTLVLRNRAQTLTSQGVSLPRISVEMSSVDTAPVSDEGCEIDGIQSQRSYRNVPAALAANLAYYEEILVKCLGGLAFPFGPHFNPASSPTRPFRIPRLASQISPKYNALALRATCPVSGFALAEKHGRLNRYNPGRIIFSYPHYAKHSIFLSDSDEVARLKANAPTRNFIRCNHGGITSGIAGGYVARALM